uniref:Reverse transcriptase N-terminal domain-containing protein n=1 Tax=Betaphycus gelatinus TaxID=1191690 RepID=A0A8E7PGI6_9FLOR|nr:hypothetical protein [Betaphycus gelatinus]
MTVLKMSSWKSLPWQKINNRVFTLQEKVYKFSAQCKQQSVYKLQDYMLNSSDMKLFAIQSIYNKIKQYYILADQEKYNVEDCDKQAVYSYLVNGKQDNEKNQIIIKNIKQYLVYLCLKPEWNARFEPMYKFNINDQQKYYFIYRLSNFLLNYANENQEALSIQNYSLNSQKINKFINIYSLSYRMQTLPSISYHIDFWLQNQDLPENLWINSNLYIKSKTGMNHLSHLLYSIIGNGFEWYNMITLHYQCKSRRLFNNLYSSLYESTAPEIFTKYRFNSKISLKVIRSLYDIIGYYNCNSNYISIYSKEKNNISKDFGTIYQIKVKNNQIFVVRTNLINYKYFIRYIKKHLYHYDSINRLRANIVMNSVSIIMKIHHLALDFYKCNYPLINFKNINEVFQLLDNMLVKWLKKNKKSKSLICTYSEYLHHRAFCQMSNDLL